MDNTSYIPPESSSVQGSPPLADMITKLMSNPELMGIIASAIGKQDASKDSAPSTDRPESETTPAASPIEDSISQGSDISSKLPEVMAALAPMLSGGGKGLSEAMKKTAKQDDRRSCLLRAIKPYVSHGRGEAIDLMLRLAGISEILKNLN